MLICPDAFDCAKNVLRIVTCVSDTPPLASVLRVRIEFFCSFLRRMFLFWSVSCALILVAETEVTALLNAEATLIVVEFVTAVTLLSSNAPAAPVGSETISPTLSSFVKSVWKPLTVVPEVHETRPLSVILFERTTSAVKSGSPTCASFRYVCLT